MKHRMAWPILQHVAAVLGVLPGTIYTGRYRLSSHRNAMVLLRQRSIFPGCRERHISVPIIQIRNTSFSGEKNDRRSRAFRKCDARVLSALDFSRRSYVERGWHY